MKEADENLNENIVNINKTIMKRRTCRSQKRKRNCSSTSETRKNQSRKDSEISRRLIDEISR